MSNLDFFGVFPYLVSPVQLDGTINKAALVQLIEHLIKAGVHGLTPLGSTGEFAYLTWTQKKEIVDIVIKTSAGRVPVVAGVFHTSTSEACRQAMEYEAMGVNGILAIIDSYFPLKEKQVYSYFVSIAESVSLPVVIYNNPRFQKTDLSIDLIKDLAEHKNIKYLKDASGNTGKLLSILNMAGDKIKLFSASASIPLSVMMLGGVGWMAGPACVIPNESVKLYNLASQKRWDEALILQKNIWSINSIFQNFNMAACIKAALEIQGFKVGDPILPLLPLKTEEKEYLKKELSRIHKIIV
jgi:4-hydroxy-tetrahydrodipicolinate synthase